MAAGDLQKRCYYFSAVSRSPFDPGRFPQSLNVAGGRARLDNFDASAGNLWSFRFVGGHASVFSEPKVLAMSSRKVGSKGRDDEAGGVALTTSREQRCFTLACMNCNGARDQQQVMYLAPDLSVVPDEGRAQLWQCMPLQTSSKSLLPGELVMQIRAHGSDKMLCSDDRRLNVYLLKPADAAMLDPVSGNFIFNDTWEATPDEDPPEELIDSLLESLQ
eukprot:gb/GFBE01023763.1/.p1 GENE.gb/GFBE01023763.1/~~gb/GFBE01023763.1/.p1  ORF type:complete len:218 (+),score=49.03 gb/GFBE01023763.1/:1-654(+)